MKKVIVLSLGGSLIIPDKVNTPFLNKFKKTILDLSKKYKFVIVCGGGSIARKYIYSLREARINEKFQSFAGIAATRTNARFMNYFFNIDPKEGIPHTLKSLKKYVKTKDIIFCGALDYKPNQTSDATASEISREYNTIFINLTNVEGLFDKNPFKYKRAKLIKRISWKDFDKMASIQKFRPGQHFALDQKASKIILKNKIKTYIIGKDTKQLKNILSKKEFLGSLISE
jgi:uridylate kinase